MDGTVSFNQPWATYKAGFGNVGVNGSHWLGNDALHLLSTSCGEQELRVDMAACDGSTAYEVYSTFSV